METHVWFRNLNSLSGNVTSELAETHALTVGRHCWTRGPVATAAGLPEICSGAPTESSNIGRGDVSYRLLMVAHFKPYTKCE